MEIDLLLSSEGNDRYTELMVPSSIRFWDLSRLTKNDRIFTGVCRAQRAVLVDIQENPLAIVHQAIQLYTQHAIYKARGFHMDYYDNRDNEWARDVHYDEPSIYAPLTNAQIKKLSQASPFSLDLEASVTQARLSVKFTASALQQLDHIWDLGGDSDAVKGFLDSALRALCQASFDDKNEYLNIYYQDAGPAHTLREFIYKPIPQNLNQAVH